MDIKERLTKIAKRNSKVQRVGNQHWPYEKKLEAVSQYLLLGNMKQVSVLTGVKYETLKDWKASPWWLELEKELRATENIKMDVKLSKIVEKSLDATLDRVENGDFIYDQKSGEIRRKPAALRDLHRVAVDTLAKRELLRDSASDRKETTQVSMDEQLKMLAMEMAKWFHKETKPVIELTEVEDAVYEEREEGLQEGEREVQLSPGSSGEESGEEPSESGNDKGREGQQG